MNKKIATAAALIALAGTTHAADLEITLINATHSVAFTPLFAAAHNDSVSLFATGTAASDELKAMAEGGTLDGLVAQFTTANANIADGDNPGAPGASNGPITGSQTVSFNLSTDEGNDYLSLGAMLLPTNDGFVGLSNWKIPTEAGTYQITLNAYDAGTENNDELVDSIPNPPFVTGFGNPTGNEDVTSGGTGVVATGVEGGVVHTHPGNLGDLDANGGASDINSAAYRWLNPVARVIVTVK